MKFKHKCVNCNRLGTRKYRGIYFCDRCHKWVTKKARVRRIRAVIGEKIYASIPTSWGSMTIYRDIVVKLK